MKPWIPFLVAATLANLALALFLRGSFFHAIVVYAAVAYVALPLAIVGVLSFVARNRSPIYRRISRTALVAFAAVASIVVSLHVGSIFNRRDIVAAKEFCESLVPKLEKYRVEHGAYPKDIKLVNDRELPRLLRSSSFYSTDGSEYGFSFSDPAGMMNGFAFDSSRRKWFEWH